ncbi:hypothetical protein NC652_029583 [Populus alba x Populus x berolinensis]|uniref:glutaredoxin-dependent peroxiredoxin n=1 Tax=Populus alba x Populus x berolinensis TaxID=444605 RepID=A0AAD6M1Q7_9ROSI|nr:hypothetical protein NC652_029583 [Populus alba x Populus x berolinensis]KAJ6977358.1 hypothetical protein NC653_029307 [Populus alba x Populus x berolinensis]
MRLFKLVPGLLATMTKGKDSSSGQGDENGKKMKRMGRNKLLKATLSDSDRELQTTTISSLASNKKSILFVIPGAFTPTWSQKHLSSFVEKLEKLKSKGVDTIACILVNDVFVMRA